MRVDKDGRKFIIHKSTESWVEVVEIGIYRIKIIHPRTKSVVSVPLELYDIEATNLPPNDIASVTTSVSVQPEPYVFGMKPEVRKFVVPGRTEASVINEPKEVCVRSSYSGYNPPMDIMDQRLHERGFHVIGLLIK